jgi:hypothetical protein
VADHAAGLQVIDVSNPAVPRRLGGFDTSGDACGVQVVGTLAYVADGLAGLQVIDVSDPAAPRRLGGFDTSGYALGVQVVGNLAYVADGNWGLQMIRVSSGLIQSLTFAPPSSVLLTNSTVPLDATASSGLPVTYRVVSGPGTVTGHVLTLTGAGSVVLRAEQGGSPQFLPASLERTITVLPAPHPLQLAGTSLSSDGRLSFRLEGLVGRSVILEFSIDLRTWFPVSTNTLPGFVEPLPISGSAAGFYRAILE